MRLHKDIADKAGAVTDPFTIIQSNQNKSTNAQEFSIKIADNFDLNPDTLHGNKSIHILNQIIVSTSKNDEILTVVADILTDALNEIAKLDTNAEPIPPQLQATVSTPYPSNFCNKMATCDPFHLPLLTYGLIKYFNDTTSISSICPSTAVSLQIPLLSGFLATYLPWKPRSIHKVSFLIPLNKDPSSESTAKIYLEDTQHFFIDSNYQKEAVLVVDEKIYRSCVKVKRQEPDMFRNVFVYAGDFHVMKSMMIVIWSILKGSQLKKYFRQIKLWLDALEPFLIAPAMFRNGYGYSNTQDKMKIKWSTLNDQLTDYRFETCGECKGSCTRCNCYKNNLSCTVFCKCNQDMCYNRNIYGSSSQQLKNKLDKLQDINESHSDMALNESNIDPEVKYSDSNVTSTPTGRRLSSTTV
ncbi:unnamed protein product, partial [Rotaria socialis]